MSVPMAIVADSVILPALVATVVLIAIAYSLWGWLVKYRDDIDPQWHFYAHLAVTFVSLFVFIVNGFFRSQFGDLFAYIAMHF